MAPSLPANSDVPQFLRLPLELRYEVYQLLLVPAYGANDKKLGPNSEDPKYHVQIMTTCRQIHNEAAQVFWKKNLWIGLRFSHGSKGSLALQDLGMDRMMSKHELDLSNTALQIHVLCIEPFRKISTTCVVLNAYHESDLLNGFLHHVSYQSWDSPLQISFGKISVAPPSLLRERFFKPLAVSLRPKLFSVLGSLKPKILSLVEKEMPRLHYRMDVLRIHFRSVLATIKLLDQQNNTSAAIALAANCSKTRRVSALQAIDDLKAHAPPESRADLLKLTIALAAYKVALKLSLPSEAPDMHRAAASLKEVSWPPRMDEFPLVKDQAQALYFHLKAVWSANRDNLAGVAESLRMADSRSVPSGNKFGIHEIYSRWSNWSGMVARFGYVERKVKRMLIKSIELDRLDKLLGI
ncbi:MAG: hypothetical protein Q9214_006946 [Letrouitia sp. 1 TL-2023]